MSQQPPGDVTHEFCARELSCYGTLVFFFYEQHLQARQNAMDSFRPGLNICFLLVCVEVTQKVPVDNLRMLNL